MRLDDSLSASDERQRLPAFIILAKKEPFRRKAMIEFYLMGPSAHANDPNLFLITMNRKRGKSTVSTYQDQTLTCADCSGSFIFTAGEQQFYAEKGFANTPKRCNDCRSKKRAQSRVRPSRAGDGPSRVSGSHRGGDRPRFPAVCSRCGSSFDAPFQPKPDRPILCRSCFKR